MGTIDNALIDGGDETPRTTATGSLSNLHINLSNVACVNTRTEAQSVRPNPFRLLFVIRNRTIVNKLLSPFANPIKDWQNRFSEIG